MDEKTHQTNGKVKISTAEYRELIERSLTAEKNADDYRSKYWNEQSARKESDKLLEVCKSKVDDLMQFLTDEKLLDKFKLWKISKQQEEE